VTPHHLHSNNSSDDNFAGIGETAILSNYRKTPDNLRMVALGNFTDLKHHPKADSKHNAKLPTLLLANKVLLEATHATQQLIPLQHAVGPLSTTRGVCSQPTSTIHSAPSGMKSLLLPTRAPRQPAQYLMRCRWGFPARRALRRQCSRLLHLHTKPAISSDSHSKHPSPVHNYQLAYEVFTCSRSDTQHTEMSQHHIAAAAHFAMHNAHQTFGPPAQCHSNSG
jgi:hypothetical protein